MAIYRYQANDLLQDLQEKGDIETYVQNVVDARTTASKKTNALGCSAPEPLSPETVGNILFSSLMQGHFIGPFEHGDVSFANIGWINRINATAALQLLLSTQDVSAEQRTQIESLSTEIIPHFAELDHLGMEVACHIWEPKEKDLLYSAIKHRYGKEIFWALRYDELKPRQVGQMKRVVKSLYDFYVMTFNSRFPFPDLLRAASENIEYLSRVVDIQTDNGTYRTPNLASGFPLENIPAYKQEYIETVIRQVWHGINSQRMHGKLMYADYSRVESAFTEKLKEKSEATTTSWLSIILPSKK